MQTGTVNSQQSVGTMPQFQDGPVEQAQPRGMQRFYVRHSFSQEASARRKRIFCLCILCWLMVLCLTGIIIIAVVHFQSSDSKIDQITAGALIGFGLLLVVVLGWSAFVYSKFQKGSTPRRDSPRPYGQREDILAFASSEILARGASTISTNNSMSHSDSSTDGNPPRQPVFIIREPHRDNRRGRLIADPLHTRRFVTCPPAPAIHRSTRVLREYHERFPGVARPQVLHFPERPRGFTEPMRLAVDADRSTRHVRAYSNPLPPPYQPQLVWGRPLSESLPMGLPPPAYDRVIGRRRGRCGSTASLESTLYPPDYQSSPPSPSHLQPAASAERRTSASSVERRTSLTISPDQPRIDLGIQISSSLPHLGRARRLSDTPQQQSSQQPTPFSSAGMTTVTSESVIYQSPPRSPSVLHGVTPVSTESDARQPSISYVRSAATLFQSTGNSPNQLHQPTATLVSSSRVSERPTHQSHSASPVYLTNNRSPFSRPILSLTGPENIIQESADHEENEQINGENLDNEISRSANLADRERPNVVLVYLSQAQEEEIIV
ncbi:uncharacterized protein LOC141876872 [Acropora palmata]|uniref:uncharacterized protein LOC141876872 n=1 Tax=Acropora palmata TaxID=6131 RepID=UPI003DA073F3